MNVGLARPAVSELVFHLYNRTVHPELFSIAVRKDLACDGYAARVSICDAGHTVTFQWMGETVTEICTTSRLALPQNRRCLSRRLRGQRDASFKFAHGLRYHSSVQLEKLDTEVFMNLHEEISLDCDKAKISHRFSSASRLAPSPLSLIQTDLTRNSLLVHAFHTFPEERAIVKTQSLFELV